MSALPRPVIIPVAALRLELRRALRRDDVEVAVVVDQRVPAADGPAHDRRSFQRPGRRELDQFGCEAQPLHRVAQHARAPSQLAAGRVLGGDAHQRFEQRRHLVGAAVQPGLYLGGAIGHAGDLSRARLRCVKIAAVTTAQRWIHARPADVIDLFVYVVVLNLAIEYVPSVISESFTLSLLTAALLKITLELVILLKGQILTRLHAADTRRAKLAAGVSLWVVAAGSKLVVLELVDIVFGDSVSLGGFISVTLLVVALLVSRAAVRRLLYGTAPTT